MVLLDQPLLWAVPELRRRLAEQAARHVEASTAAEPPARQACVATEHPEPVNEPAEGRAACPCVAVQAPASAAGGAAGGAAVDWQPGPGARAAAGPAACPAGGPAIVVADAAARHLDPGEDVAGAAGGAASTSGHVCAAGYTWELPAGVQARHNQHHLACKTLVQLPVCRRRQPQGAEPALTGSEGRSSCQCMMRQPPFQVPLPEVFSTLAPPLQIE